MGNSTSSVWSGPSEPVTEEIVEAPKRKAGRPKGAPNKSKIINQFENYEEILLETQHKTENEVKEKVLLNFIENNATPTQPYKMSLGVYKTHPDVPTPEYGTNGAACFDLKFSPKGKISYTGYNQNNSSFERDIVNGKITIAPGDVVMIPTGLIFDIPTGFSLRVFPRSSTGLKRHLLLSNSVGVIDEDYVDEIMLMFYNAGTINQVIEEGERLAQAELVPVIKPVLQVITDKPSLKGNRIGGLGSTGV